MENKIAGEKEYSVIEMNVQAAFAEWGKYIFRYFPKERYFETSKYAVAKMNAPEKVTDFDDNLFIDHVVEKDRIFDVMKRIDNGEKYATTVVASTGKSNAMRFSLSAVSFDEDGKTVEAVGLIERLDEDLRRSEIISALASNFNSVYYVDVDEDKVYAYKVISAVKSSLGDKIQSIPGYADMMLAYVAQMVLPEDKETMLQETSIENLRKQFRQKNTYQHDYRIVRDGEVKYCRAKFVNISGVGELHRMVAGFADISSEKQRELERMAYTDPVTGGNNYESFKEKLKECTDDGFIISMDIHAFKIINSICGVAKGDQTLKGIWRCIKEGLDTHDIAGHINADRFIIFNQEHNEERVRSKLTKLNERLVELSEALKVPKIIPYFGITEWNRDKKVEEAYSEANFAKNQVKDRKDVIYQFYSHDDTVKMLEEKAMEDDFQQALGKEQFEIWYQPKYDPSTNEMVGAEGLVRWRDDDGNIVSPGKFIPLFERNGYIKILDEYVFRKVCNQQLKWKKSGMHIVPVSINLSRASLYFESVVKRYHDIADEVGVDTEYVPIEITESAAIDNDNIKGLADKFHNSGFSLLVDDFGSGYSSLATLNMKCFDTLKIDKSLIDYIGDFSGERLLEHTIALAKELGLYVTAEGVEKENQVDFLKRINCDSIQGFYYSRPLPTAEFEKLLA